MKNVFMISIVLALIAILFATNMKPIAQKKESCCGVY